MAKINQPELSKDNDYFATEFKIDSIINPKLETALEMYRQISVPGELKADAHEFAAVYAASQRKSGAGNALISVSLIL